MAIICTCRGERDRRNLSATTGCKTLTPSCRAVFDSTGLSLDATVFSRSASMVVRRDWLDPAVGDWKSFYRIAIRLDYTVHVRAHCIESIQTFQSLPIVISRLMTTLDCLRARHFTCHSFSFTRWSAYSGTSLQFIISRCQLRSIVYVNFRSLGTELFDARP